MILQSISLGTAVILAYYCFSKKAKRKAIDSFNKLIAQEDSLIDDAAIERAYNASVRLEYLSGRLGAAGLYSKEERMRFFFILAVGSITFITLFSLILGTLGLFIGIYISVLFVYGYLTYLTRDHEREILYRLPLALESFILLVESGLGILPAMEKLISSEQRNPVLRVMSLVYHLSAHGLPFNRSSTLVANVIQHRPIRHVLLHLDISGSEGGEVIPSLKSLADHAHREWKQSVSFRIKRLEQNVVFPVFASVMGLLALAVSVPLASVIDFRDSLMEGKDSLRTIEESINDQ